jgi:hypothetical protein
MYYYLLHEFYKTLDWLGSPLEMPDTGQRAILLQQYQRNTYKKKRKQNQFHKKFLCDSTFRFTDSFVIPK